jgi:hypothetical protein
MALNKFKQKNRDEVLDKASRSEHGMARFAHLNEVVSAFNEAVFTDVTVAVLIGRDFPENAAAVAAGLEPGDLYHTQGVLKIVL